MVNKMKKSEEMFNDIIKLMGGDLFGSLVWARDKLMRHEGEGHIFNILANDEHQVCCCFSKPEWNADHCGEYMDDGSEAVIMVVCEYLDGE